VHVFRLLIAISKAHDRLHDDDDDDDDDDDGDDEGRPILAIAGCLHLIPEAGSCQLTKYDPPRLPTRRLWVLVPVPPLRKVAKQVKWRHAKISWKQRKGKGMSIINR